MRCSFCRLAILTLLSGLGAALSAYAAGAAQPQTATSSSRTAVSPSDYAGAETCALCHKAEVDGFNKDPHAKLALEHSGKGVTCESCHGPGRAHVESGGVATQIFQFTKATPKQVEKKCLSCHVGEHPNFERTVHGEALISCTSCHSIHKFESSLERDRRRVLHREFDIATVANLAPVGC